MSIPGRRTGRPVTFYEPIFVTWIHTFVISIVTRIYSPEAMAGKAFRTRPGKGSFSADTAAFDGTTVSVRQQYAIYVFYQETHKYTCKFDRESY